jgi:hypothetical protein
MTRENAAQKARRYLCEGRVTLQRVDQDRVIGSCRGDGTVYRVVYWRGAWSCDCPARTDQCAHLLAVRLVVVVDVTAEAVG